MEKFSPIEKNKSIEPKFLLNKFNGLLKSNEEINKSFYEGAEQIFSESTDDVRKEQLRLYKEFTKNVLGEDIVNEPEKDPFFQVAGVPIEKVYLDKWEDMEHYEVSAVFVPTTTLLSGNYLLESSLKNRFINVDEQNAYLERIEGDIKYDISLFDPVFLNKKREWLLQFGFITFEKRENNTRINEGLFVLEPGVIELIEKNSESENISQKLQEILTWFNHDLISHGTFLPREGSRDSDILLAGGKNKLKESFANESVMKEGAFSSAFAGELWSLNFHESVFQKIVEERPAVMRYLRAHLDNYARSVEIAVKDIPNAELAHDVKEYLLKAYAFGFFRLINPKDFDTKPEFKDLKGKYPELADLGIEEEKTREYTFGEQGLLSIEKDGKRFIPHSEVFADFTESFDDAKEFRLLIRNLNESLHSGTSTIFPSERQKLRKILKGFTPGSLAELVQNKLNLNVDEFGGDYFERYQFLIKNSKVVKTVLLDEGTTNQNFAKRIKKQVYGFMGTRITLIKKK